MKTFSYQIYLLSLILYFQLHLVHLNSKYPNVSVGLTISDGLAVLGVLLKVQNLCFIYCYIMNKGLLTILFSSQKGKENKNYDFLYLAKNNISEQSE